jgi:hypothetical protein
VVGLLHAGSLQAAGANCIAHDASQYTQHITDVLEGEHYDRGARVQRRRAIRAPASGNSRTFTHTQAIAHRPTPARKGASSNSTYTGACCTSTHKIVLACRKCVLWGGGACSGKCKHSHMRPRVRTLAPGPWASQGCTPDTGTSRPHLPALGSAVRGRCDRGLGWGAGVGVQQDTNV